MSEPRDTLILCTRERTFSGHALWWRPNSCGYCVELEGAGRYTRTEAERICSGLPDVPVSLADAMAVAVTVVDFNKVKP